MNETGQKHLMWKANRGGKAQLGVFSLCMSCPKPTPGGHRDTRHQIMIDVGIDDRNIFRRYKKSMWVKVPPLVFPFMERTHEPRKIEFWW